MGQRQSLKNTLSKQKGVNMQGVSRGNKRKDTFLKNESNVGLCHETLFLEYFMTLFGMNTQKAEHILMHRWIARGVKEQQRGGGRGVKLLRKPLWII